MALAHLPPDPLDTEKQELADWFSAAFARLRSSEVTTYDSFLTFFSEAYERLSISQSEGGSVPSTSSFAALAPVLRKMRLSQVNQSADELEEITIGFLHTIPAKNARKLIGQLMLGRPSGNFLDQLEKLELELEPEAETPVKIYAEHEHPGGSYLEPTKPSHDPRDRPEDRIKNADRIMRKLVGGEEAGG